MRFYLNLGNTSLTFFFFFLYGKRKGWKKERWSFFYMLLLNTPVKRAKDRKEGLNVAWPRMHTTVISHQACHGSVYGEQILKRDGRVVFHNDVTGKRYFTAWNRCARVFQSSFKRNERDKWRFTRNNAYI